jgi:D-serine deaminase-like pyridoxal phosphate-dependent protein
MRRTMVWQCQEILRIEKARLEKAGYPCPTVSGGGSGTWDLAAECGVLTEVQAGSYVLMDAKYATIDIPFENALFCCTTLISRRGRDAAVLNAGLKSMTVEYGMPKSVDGSFSVITLADEHARINAKPDWPAKVGDPVLLVPPHIDPAINLHDVVLVHDRGVARHWTVDGRRRPSERAGGVN